MGMPITLQVVDSTATEELFNTVFSYFEYVDQKFSTYKDDSEITLLNQHKISLEESSEDMRIVFALAEQTRQESQGYFDIAHNGAYDPSGLVKGWSIYNAAEILRGQGCKDFYVDAGGDVEAVGRNIRGENWRAGIRNPFNAAEIVQVLSVSNCGIATSGTYVRGQHIYNPKDVDQPITDILSLTVIGPNVYEADRFATAAFAMGRRGIEFVERLDGFEGYMIDRDQQATFTSGFERYVNRD
jgi:thiamine biosynthesis lipoprotein